MPQGHRHLRGLRLGVPLAASYAYLCIALSTVTSTQATIGAIRKYGKAPEYLRIGKEHYAARPLLQEPGDNGEAGRQHPIPTPRSRGSTSHISRYRPASTADVSTLEQA